MTEMNDEPTRRSSKTAANAAILVALPLLYVLSVGPVFYLLDVTQWSWRHPRLMKSIVTMYSPLRPLFEHPFLGPPFQRYTQWWLELPNESLMRSDPFFPIIPDVEDLVLEPTKDPFAIDSVSAPVQDPK